jgi:hypothetical protein
MAVIKLLWIAADFVLHGTAQAASAKGGLGHGMSAERLKMGIGYLKRGAVKQTLPK